MVRRYLTAPEFIPHGQLSTQSTKSSVSSKPNNSLKQADAASRSGLIQALDNDLDLPYLDRMVKEILGEEAFLAAWAKGQAMSHQQAFTLALEARAVEPRFRAIDKE